MNLYKCSTQADASCVVYCRSQARLLLRAACPEAEINAKLVKVLSKTGVFYVWTDMDSKNEEVALLSGSVELCMHADGTSVKLVPGDIIRYDKEKGNVRTHHSR